MKKCVLLVALLLGSSAYAGNVSGTGWGMVCRDVVMTDGTLTQQCRKKPKFNYLGLQIDVGAPSLLGLSIIGRPLRFWQFELGGNTSLVGGGVKAGTTLFVSWYISPGLTIEGGKMWAGDINKLAVMVGMADPKIALLKSVEYEYVSFLGSIGFGHSNWFYFRLYAGYSYITTTTNGLQSFIQDKANTASLSVSEAVGKVWSPTGKIAFQFYF
jgi:hypothetical protein